MNAPAPDGTKSDWRAWARATRAELDFPALSTSVVEALASWQPLVKASKVLLFLPLADEIDLSLLASAGLRCSFVATRTPDEGGALTVHELGGPLEKHRFGFMQPGADAPELDPAELDVLLLPGLAFDLWGTRLGRGAGYFDRLLMRVDLATPVVGVTPAAVVVDRLPLEVHDMVVGFIATEEGVIEVAA